MDSADFVLGGPIAYSKVYEPRGNYSGAINVGIKQPPQTLGVCGFDRNVTPYDLSDCLVFVWVNFKQKDQNNPRLAEVKAKAIKGGNIFVSGKIKTKKEVLRLDTNWRDVFVGSSPYEGNRVNIRGLCGQAKIPLDIRVSYRNPQKNEWAHRVIPYYPATSEIIDSATKGQKKIGLLEGTIHGIDPHGNRVVWISGHKLVI